jgi:hypothetical protein
MRDHQQGNGQTGEREDRAFDKARSAPLEAATVIAPGFAVRLIFSMSLSCQCDP